jgi:(R,R)-butanediol dehydrogenase/meso-butanediol dehydrogenase/diacetyl reductase
VYIPKTRHPLTGVAPPVTLGHEFAGRVAEVGTGVAGLRPGDRVAVNPCLTCGTCRWCGSGRPNHCARLGTIGLSRDGALAPLVAVPAGSCHVLPPEVSDEAGATVEPLAVTVHARRRGGLRGGERVVILGGGPIGLLMLQVARAGGAAWIAVLEPRQARRGLAQGLGADAVIDPTAADAARAVDELTGGARADVVFECVGSAAAVHTAVRAAGKGGRVVLVGLTPEPVTVNALQLLAHEKEMVGSSAYVDEFPEAIGLLATGRVRAEPLITGRVALERSVAEGLEALLRPDTAHVKILVTPGGGGAGR